MRCFIALELPEETRNALLKASERLAPFFPGARWTRSESLHVTLAFLGDIEGSALECARAAVDSAAGSGSFFLDFSRPLFLPERGPVRVLALEAGPGADECRRVHELVNRALDQAAQDRGLPPLNPDWPSGRAFRAHVTLARASGRPFRRKSAVPWNEICREPQSPRPVSRCILYKSELRPGGARYEPLHASVL